MKHLLLFLSLFLSFAVSGQEAFDIKNYQVQINVNGQGNLQVDEILDVYFNEERRGIIREVPYIYTIQGERYIADISNIEVAGHKSKISRSRGMVNLRIGDPNIYLNGEQRYKISYDVDAAVVQYEDHDEFYWNVIPFNSDVESEIASFSIRFPEAWADSLTSYQAYTGRSGNKTADLFLKKTGAQFSAATTKPLGIREGITFAVHVPKGLVSSTVKPFVSKKAAKKARQESSKLFQTVSKWAVGIPIAIALFLLGLWNKVKPKSKLEKDPPLQYHAPVGFNPAEVGTFWDYTAHTHDIIALLPYWGDQGTIKIKPLEKSEGDMYFTKVAELPHDSYDYEFFFFNELFADGDVVLLSDLKEKFYTTMPKTASRIKKAVLKRPLYDEAYKRTFHNHWVTAGILFLIMFGIATMLIFEAFVAGIGMFLIAIVLLIIRVSEPALSTKGKEIKNHLKGLKKWLKDPAPDKLNNLMKEDPNYIFQMFPYAIAFGLDRSWQQSMDDMHIEPPTWYDTSSIHMSTGGGYTMGRMISDFQPKEIGQVFNSTPPPANNGSSGGGGFSGSAGGGMGGGSVSSW